MDFYNITAVLSSIAHQAYTYAENCKKDHFDPLIQKTQCFQSHEKELLIASLATNTIIFLGGLYTIISAKRPLKLALGLFCIAASLTSVFYQYVTLDKFTCGNK